MVRFVLFLHCPAVRVSVPFLLVDVPASVVASYVPSSRRSRRASSLPSSCFLSWLEDALRSRGVALPRGWVFVRRASQVRLSHPLPLVVL